MESVRALVIGDLHLSGQNLAETELAVRDIVALVHRDLDMVVFLGDVQDKFQSVHVSALRVMHDMFEAIHAKVGDRTRVFVVTGNHDRPNNQHYLTNEHPFHGIMHLATVAADRAVEAHVKGHRFVFVPYVPDGRFAEAIADSHLTVQGVSCVFAHQTFKGAHLGSCISETGDEWAPDMPLVISGHIHGFDVLQPNLIYAGACMQHGYADSPDRAVMDCTFRDTCTYTRVRLPSVPLKQRVNMTCDELKTYKPQPNTLVQICLTGTTHEIQTVLKLARVRNLPSTVRITVNRLLEHNAVVLSDIPTFARLVETSIASTHPHLLEYHKEIVKLVKDAR